MPIRAVVQIGKNECNEVVFLLQAVPHDLHNAEEAPDGFLSDDVFAVGELFDDQGDVPSEDGVAEAPLLVLGDLLFHDFVVPFPLLLHPNDHIQNVQSVEHDFEVLVREQLNEEVQEALWVDHHVVLVSFDPVLDVVKELVNRFGPHAPVVLGIHHPLDLVRRNELLTPFLGLRAFVF